MVAAQLYSLCPWILQTEVTDFRMVVWSTGGLLSGPLETRIGWMTGTCTQADDVFHPLDGQLRSLLSLALSLHILWDDRVTLEPARGPS